MLFGDILIGSMSLIYINEHHTCRPTGLHFWILRGNIDNLTAWDTTRYLCLTILKWPIHWTNTGRLVMNTVVYVKMCIVSLEDNAGWTIKLPRYKVEMTGASQFINLIATPYWVW